MNARTQKLIKVIVSIEKKREVGTCGLLLVSSQSNIKRKGSKIRV